jgi:hypothetical protein
MYILNYIGSNPPFCFMQKGPRFNPLFIFWVRIFRQLRKVHFIRKFMNAILVKSTQDGCQNTSFQIASWWELPTSSILIVNSQDIIIPVHCINLLNEWFMFQYSLPGRGVSTENSAYGKHYNYVLHLLFINFSRYSCLCVLHGFCKITSRKWFNKSFLGRSHMVTLGAKTSQWRPLQVAPMARALLAIP